MSGDWYTRPIIAVADIHRALAFYTARLGFTEAWRYGEGGELWIVQVDRAGTELILSSQPRWAESRGKARLFCSLGDGSLATMNAARAELEARGAPVTDGQWGYRLFVVTDPDGNQLYFADPGHPE